MALARPMLAFEVDRLTLVTGSDIESAQSVDAPEPLRKLSRAGPLVVSAQKPFDSDAQFRRIELGLADVAVAALPKCWRDYAAQAGDLALAALEAGCPTQWTPRGAH